MKQIVKTQYFKFAHPPDELVLESGQKLGPVTVAYETYGELNRDKSNAILICHALSGDAHVAFWHAEDDAKPGWWDIMVGPGKAFDTDKYFIICSNILGGCKGTTGPSSLDPKTNKPYALSFPVITIADMVDVQKKLVDHLGIRRLYSMVGGSMGGMQVIDWTLRYPSQVCSAIVIAATSRLSAQGIAFNAAGRNAICSDPHWNNGNYYGTPGPEKGLAIARMIGHITYLSEESMHQKFGRRLQDKQEYGFDLSTDFQVESYLQYQGEAFVGRFDANSYLYITKAMDYFDVEKRYGSLVDAFATTQSKFLFISYSSDWLFLPSHSKEMVKALMNNNKEVTYCEISSWHGHDAFLLEEKQQTRIIESFLANVTNTIP